MILKTYGVHETDDGFTLSEFKLVHHTLPDELFAIYDIDGAELIYKYSNITGCITIFSDIKSIRVIF
jgi:hypothetical protein